MLIAKLRQLVQDRTITVLKDKKNGVDLPVFDLSIPPPKIPGDLAANVVLMLAKKLGEPPRKLAEEILKGLPQNDFVQKAEIAGPGFLNFWINDAGLRAELESLLGENNQEKKSSGDKILFEFVSANPTGPLHIGHGRGAALGDSLVRIFKYVGYDATAEFYINDSGGQIRNLGLSMEARLKELNGEKAELPENGYKGEYVIDLAKEAKESGKTFTPVKSDQMTFTGDDLAGFASEKILKLIQSNLDSFGVHFDSWFKESDLHAGKHVAKLFDEFKEKKVLYEEDGAVWFKSTDFGDEKDRVLKKANEAPTYFAADIAYHRNKFSRGYKRLINIWGADHHGYAQRLNGAMTALGFNAKQLTIIFNQMVSIKGGKMSKRAGSIVQLSDVVADVGRDAVRFFFALRSPGTHFEFDLDLAKKQASDNPVYYVQYVHARCCSIFREAEKRGFDTDTLAWKKLKLSAPLEASERNILLHLGMFDRTVEACARDLSNHHITVYLLELAGKYHSFYENCQVLVDDAALRSFRLGLIDAIRKRVALGLELLGVSAPEKL